MPGSIGGDDYRNNIANCNTTHDRASATSMTPEPGNMVGPTEQGIDDLIAKDPNAYWDIGCNCVKGSSSRPSPRVVIDPALRPGHTTTTGKQNGRNVDLHDRQLHRLLHRATMQGNNVVRPHHAGQRHHRRRRPVRRRPAHFPHAPSVWFNRCHGSTRGTDRHAKTTRFKSTSAALLRAGAVPVGIIEDRAGRDGAPPDLVHRRHPRRRVVSDGRPSSGCAPARRTPASSRSRSRPIPI